MHGIYRVSHKTVCTCSLFVNCASHAGPIFTWSIYFFSWIKIDAKNASNWNQTCVMLTGSLGLTMASPRNTASSEMLRGSTSWRMWSVTAGGAACHDRSRVTSIAARRTSSSAATPPTPTLSWAARTGDTRTTSPTRPGQPGSFANMMRNDVTQLSRAFTKYKRVSMTVQWYT